jgi:flagellar motility protein MotE (MotC chaperone)
MMRFARDLRLIPIVLFASVCLLALKTADLLLDRGSGRAGDNAPAAQEATGVVHTMPDAVPVAAGQHSWAQQMFNFPDGGATSAARTSGLPPLVPIARNAALPDVNSNSDITGSVRMAEAASPDKGGANSKDAKDPKAAKDSKDSKDAKDAKESKDSKEPKDAKDAPGAKEIKTPDGTVIISNGAPLPTGAERAILERLSERREQLDARARELDIREGLIQAAEKRMEAQLAEIKSAESHITEANNAKQGAEAERFKGLVTMYENMKARDAAKIFERLEIGVLIEVASQINPRRMSDILAQMTPESAERLTVELANRARAIAKTGVELPKIEGRPTSP